MPLIQAKTWPLGSWRPCVLPAAWINKARDRICGNCGCWTAANAKVCQARNICTKLLHCTPSTDADTIPSLILEIKQELFALQF
jgi:hypothetical protein